jgi:hypothetical protein
MEEKFLLGREQKILEIPQATWKQSLAQTPPRLRNAFGRQKLNEDQRMAALGLSVIDRM